MFWDDCKGVNGVLKTTYAGPLIHRSLKACCARSSTTLRYRQWVREMGWDVNDAEARCA